MIEALKTTINFFFILCVLVPSSQYKKIFLNTFLSEVLRKRSANSYNVIPLQTWHPERQLYNIFFFTKIRNVPCFLQPPVIEKESESYKKMYVHQPTKDS